MTLLAQNSACRLKHTLNWALPTAYFYLHQTRRRDGSGIDYTDTIRSSLFSNTSTAILRKDSSFCNIKRNFRAMLGHSELEYCATFVNASSTGLYEAMLSSGSLPTPGALPMTDGSGLKIR